MVTYLLLGLAISVSMPVQPSAPTRSLVPVPPTSSVQARNTISGLVFSPDRRPVPELYVELMNDLESVISVTRTTGGGRYVFENLSQGNYQVRVRTQGTNYVSQTKRVNIINFTT
ncbi:MAG: carboxypeptidase-like regulatory domain-containing protein, partial [Acidobacteriota bacterium]|nr:carboxypeptidase-like regulatory domain-containing protein [Acidobacteriota bacterium]